MQLEPTDKIRMESGPKNGGVAASLTFEPVGMDDIGEIKAVAKNPAGEATSVARLNVLCRFHCSVSLCLFKPVQCQMLSGWSGIYVRLPFTSEQLYQLRCLYNGASVDITTV